MNERRTPTRGRKTHTSERAAVRAVPRRTQKERREATRRLLLETGIDCICELGFAGSMLEVITERAGITRGAVQHHFGTRDELLVAIVAELNDKLSALTAAKAMKEKSLRERLSSMCEQLWELLSSRHFIAAIQIQLGTAIDPRLSPRIRKIMIKIENDLDRRWVDLFADDDIEPERVVLARHVAQATLRGLAIKQIYRRRRDDVRAERTLLLEMLQRVLRTGRR